MSFNVSSITGYVKANEKSLIAKSVVAGKTLGLIKFIPEVKGSINLNLLTSAPTLQAGGCGWNAAGTTTLSKRTLSTALLKINESLCDKTLAGTFAEWGIQIAAGKHSLPFEEYFTAETVKQVQKQVNNLAWNGDITGSTSTYLDLTDGFIKILGAEPSVIAAKVSGKTLLANPLDAINAMVAKIPAELIDSEKVVIFVGNDVLLKYVLAYNDSNKFAGTLSVGSEITVPNTMIKLVGEQALTGKNKAYMGEYDNFIAGGDIQGAEAIYEFFYSQDNREYRNVIEFNLGVQVAFPDQVVSYID